MASSKVYNENALTLYGWVVSKEINSINFLIILLFPFFGTQAFSKEKEEGTLKLLKASNLSSIKIVTGKFISFFLVLLIILSLSEIGNFYLAFKANVDLFVFLTAMLSNILLGSAVISIAFYCSLLCENSLSAILSSILFSLLLYLLHTPAEVINSSFLNFVYDFSILWQTKDFLEGVISLSSVGYFIALIFLFLALSKLKLDNLSSLWISSLYFFLYFLGQAC